MKFCEQFLGLEQKLEKVKYFTAAPLNVGKQSRQSALFKANRLINNGKFEIVRGKYYKISHTCPKCEFVYRKPEEKRTDVNISIHLIGDCALNKTDNLVLITADSDLVPPIEFIQKNYPDKKIKVYFPPKNSSFDIFNVMNKKVIYLEKNKYKFRNSVMDEKVYSFDMSDFATIPNKWKINKTPDKK